MFPLISVLLLSLAVSSSGANSGIRRPPLLETWLQYSIGPVLHKWEEYAGTYQQLFESYHVGGHVKMLELGVQSGGSMVTWKNWFSDANFTYIGVDINPLCKHLDISNDDQVRRQLLQPSVICDLS